MILLALETSTEACSVALLQGDQVAERFELAPRRHAELVLPWCGELLAHAGIARAQLDAIAVSRGPGAFTGVRLGIAVAQGLALALERPLLPVSTLAVLAQDALDLLPAGSTGPHRVLASLDARMQEVYAGSFGIDGGSVVAMGEETVGPPSAVGLPGDMGGWVGVGTGFAALDGALPTALGDRLAAVDPTRLPRASSLARLAVAAWRRGEAVAPERVEPAYLRNHVALTLAEQQALRDRRAAPGT